MILSISSCSHQSQTRTPSSLFNCKELLSSILSSRLSYRKQNKNLRQLEDKAMHESTQYYEFQTLPRSPKTPLQALATQINLEEMRGIRRGEGIPYATHPLKLSYLSEYLIGDSSSEAERTYLYTMIHDVLEEGRSTAPESLEWLSRYFPEHPYIAQAAYKLVEPNIEEIPIPKDIPYSMIEVVGYGRQIEFFYFNQNQDRALLNASLIDKLFNVFDRFKAVQDGLVKEENFLTRMEWRLAKQGYLLKKMGPYAHPDISKYAQALHDNIRKKLGLSPTAINKKISQYRELEARYAEDIDAIIIREAQKRNLF